MASGDASQVEVARRHGVNAGTFSWWCARLGGRRGRRTAPKLVPVTVVRPREHEEDPPRGFEVVLNAGLRVRVPAGFEPAELRRLLEVVREC